MVEEIVNDELHGTHRGLEGGELRGFNVNAVPPPRHPAANEDANQCAGDEPHGECHRVLCHRPSFVAAQRYALTAAMHSFVNCSTLLRQFCHCVRRAESSLSATLDRSSNS